MKKLDPTTLIRNRLNGKTQTALAAELGITLQYLNDILHNRRAAGPQVLRALGLERVVSYRQRNAPDSGR